MKLKLMRIIEPHQLRAVRYKNRPRHRRRRIVYLLLVVLLLSSTTLATIRYQRPLPAPIIKATKQTVAEKDPLFSWPTTGQAAVGAVGYGLLSSSTDQKPVPTASVTKIVTALTVLEKKPLALGEAGESITMTEQDVAIYNKYIALNGAVVPIQVGASLTQYDALQALLMPSANNIADSLTVWAFGSEADYLVAANQFVKKLGLTQTTIADASGFSPSTVSTPSNLVVLGIAALNNPVVAKIVGQTEASLTMVGDIRSTNKLLGQSGINGIKTGNTDEAGGCYLVSSVENYPNGKSVTVVTAVMGAPTLIDAMNTARPLLTKTKQGFGDKVVVTAGQRFGTAETAWGSRSPIVAETDVSLFGWQYGSPSFVTKFDKDAGSAQVKFGAESANFKLKQTSQLGQPTAWWRLKHLLSDY